jgi:hypothetical protein
MSKEYVISGHSDDTTDTFVIPYNISLIFYANLGETCIVPHNKESLDLVVNSMKYGQFELYRQGDTINNYHITFNKKQFEGIATIQENNDNSLNYDFLQIPENINSLKEMCNFIQKSNNRANTIVYCVFCRGSKMEFEDYNFGDFNDQDIDKYLSNEDFNENDFYDLLAEDESNNNSSSTQNSIGGKRKQKQKKTTKRRKSFKKKNANIKRKTRRNKYIKKIT